MAANLVFKVTVYSEFDYEEQKFKVLAANDVAARALAIQKWIANTNKNQDKARRDDARVNDLSTSPGAYRHVGMVDVDYCEIEVVTRLD